MQRAARLYPRVPAVAFVAAVAWLAAGQPAVADHLPPPDKPFTGLKPASPQPKQAKLKPGLAVTYYLNRFNLIDELLLEAEMTKGEKGKPLPMLNYNVGRGKVLTSSREDMIGAIIKGFIKFPDAGTYTLLVQSNDGVTLTIGETQIYSDPTVHADDFSPPLPVVIDKAGWYPLEIAYFEKKNTATLELYWQPPGSTADPVFVPAEMFAHLPD